jgi:hypothetical protein
VLRLKYRAATMPDLESKQLLDHLVQIGYQDVSWQGEITKLLYKLLPLRLCRRYYP